mmetsp:Transcript_124791/g.349568  ORF Transcript_124791/g.349568 Transcript_124791/m.349568 type:complete len:610 (-) Transcript_124791:239-2068(-)|eukprot:CAMPEP_0176188356 /NCGR_PEP_ID=MMETSP0121_2-20121125/2871_1 /TAXON_ID=160619 /ORGANISM="Kryptoperidinium foliaceum, Strain CCMP 1326" /LENGTH=609 /DNA_ID=CAMNT_0017526925 /DNA_START=105 /DNA_END=1934 /DNA_ORIENTATION=+
MKQPPYTVLVINNNPMDSMPGRYTPMLMQHVMEAGFCVREARTVKDVDDCAEMARRGGHGDIALIVSCGSPVVLTEPVDVAAHVTKTTAAMLHFPHAPIVGICFGAQLLSILYGGSLVPVPDVIRGASGERAAFSQLRRTDLQGAPRRSRLLGDLRGTFVQWCSNYIFIDRPPARFNVTSVDREDRPYCMEHDQEHVYAVLFHPEVLGEGVQRTVLDNILALAGKDRRIQQQSSPNSSTLPWHRFAQSHQWLPARRASYSSGGDSGRADSATEVAAISADDSFSIGDTCERFGSRGRGLAIVRRGRRGRVGSEDAEDIESKDMTDSQLLAERLATAKREALASLQRDNTSDGGITMYALEDAIASLRRVGSSLGDDAGVAGTPRGRSSAASLRDPGQPQPAPAGAEHERDRGDICDAHGGIVPLGSVKLCLDHEQHPGAEDAEMCSAHTADLALRSVVREVLAEKAAAIAGAEAMSNPLTRGAGSSRATSVGSAHTCTSAVVAPTASGTFAMAAPGQLADSVVTMHDADISLRRLVQDAISAAATASPSSAPAAAQMFAVAKRNALAELRRARRSDGMVPKSALAKVEKSLQLAAQASGDNSAASAVAA